MANKQNGRYTSSDKNINGGRIHNNSADGQNVFEDYVRERSMQKQTADPYLQQYEQQLNEFEQLDGQYFNEDVNLEFHNYGENINQYNQSTRQTSSNGYKQQRQKSGYSPVQQKRRKKNASVQRSSNQNKHSQTAKSSNQKQRSNSLQFGSQNSSNPKKMSQQKGQAKSMKTKKHPVRSFFKIFIIILLILFIVFNLLLLRYISCVNTTKTGKRDSSITPSMQSGDVRNILVIGSDSRDSNTNGRTDSMILLSINKSSKEINMTSFMRDMYVEIKGFDSSGNPYDRWDKLNSAYVYGGAALLMDTIEYNFDIQVDDYIYIDFYSFVDIVDSIGGIELTVSDAEAEGMTAPMAEQNKIMGKKHGTDYLTHGGTMVMNGNQALAYARLRYVGNADFERTERQREVMTKIIEKVKSSNPLTIDKFAKTSASNLTTNMSKAELYLLSYKVLFSMNYETKSLRVPDEGSYTYGNHDGQSTLDVDFYKCRELLKTNIYN